MQAKINARNFSEVNAKLHTYYFKLSSPMPFSKIKLVDLYSCGLQNRYKESWTKIRDGGYKLSLDAIPFQSAKASTDILSDVGFQSHTSHCYYVIYRGIPLLVCSTLPSILK